MKNKLPNFLIIGAINSGTTALYYFLRKHPQIYMSPIKETNYFAFDGERLDLEVADITNIDKMKKISISNIEDYYKLFQDVSTEKAIGEASPSYISSPGAAQRIQKCIPNAKIVAILRHPVDICYSTMSRYSGGYEGAIEYLVETLSQTDCSQNKLLRSAISQGLYYNKIQSYFDKFNPEKIKILLYEDLQNHPKDLIRDILKFLNVDEDFVPDTNQIYNKSGQTKSKILDKILRSSAIAPLKKIVKLYFPQRMQLYLAGLQHRLHSRNMISRPQLPLDIRRKIIQNYYREDILNLQDLIQRDLSRWLI